MKQEIECYEIENGRQIVGVGLVLVSQDGKVLLVKETQADSVKGKAVGDWSIPAETRENDEGIDRELCHKISMICLRTAVC